MDVLEDYKPMESHLRWADDHKLFVQFYRKPVYQELESQTEKRPIYKEVDYVKIIIPGDKLAEINAPVDLEYATRFRARYEAFKAGVADPIKGTPLEAWPVLDPAQVAELKHLNVRSVEDLIAAPENLAKQIMGYNKLKGKAIKFVEVAAEEAAEAKLDAKVAAAVAKQAPPATALSK
jgi:hypothetical protein